MSAYRTQFTAVACAYQMWRAGFTPRSILNIGVGWCPEFSVWKWLYPHVELLGVDPRGRRRGWTARYIQAAVVGEGAASVEYCGRCQSIKCGDAKNHGRLSIVKAVRIDDISPIVPGPYFLWMDIEGGELDALRGAQQTLQNTPWINLEMREFPWTNNYCGELHSWLTERKYKLRYSPPGSEDKLYAKTDW